MMNMDNPGELMKVLLGNSEARKVLGDFIEDAITKDHVSTCPPRLLVFLHNNYNYKNVFCYYSLHSLPCHQKLFQQ